MPPTDETPQPMTGTELDPTRTPLVGMPEAARPGTELPAHLAGEPLEAPTAAEAEADKSRVAKVAEALGLAISGITGQSADEVRAFAESMAPYAQRYGVLASSPDPVTAAKAKAALRSIERQAILEAGRMGVEIQQQAEQRFLGAIGAVVAIVRMF